MKILLCIMKYDYGDSNRGYGTEHHIFYSTLKKMGHQIIYFDFMTEYQQIGKKAMNQKLLTIAKKERPDLLLSVLFQDQLEKKTIKLITKLGVKTVNWFCDDTWRFDTFSKYWTPSFKWIVTTDKEAVIKYHQAGYNNVILSNWGFNHYEYKAPKRNHYLYDVTFVGQPHSYRKKYLDYLIKKGIKVNCWGYKWPNGRLGFRQMYQVFSQSKININFTGTSKQKTGFKKLLTYFDIEPPIRQMKARLFEIPGSGGFMLTETVPNLSQYFKIGKEIDTFSSKKELLQKVNLYLKNSKLRERVAIQGNKRVMEDHTYKNRLEKIFQIVNSQ